MTGKIMRAQEGPQCSSKLGWLLSGPIDLKQPLSVMPV